MPKISIVTSVYNCEKYIGETIKSVQDQTLRDWEFILIDDCSIDNSSSIAEKIAGTDPRIKVIRNDFNQGQSVNLNNGIKMADGEYIARLDHDDICHPERLQKQLEYMENNPDAVLVASRSMILNEGKCLSGAEITQNDAEARFLAAIGIQDAIHSSFFIRKSAMEENNIWYRDYKYAEDYALYTELMTVGTVHIMEDNLMTYRVFDGNTTSKTGEMLRYNEMYEIICRYLDYYSDIESDIVRKAIRGEVAEDEYGELAEWIYSFAKRTGIGSDDRIIKKNECVRFAMFNLLLWQKGSLQALKLFYDKDLAFDKRNAKLMLRMSKHCLTGTKKKVLWFSGKEIFDGRRQEK